MTSRARPAAGAKGPPRGGGKKAAGAGERGKGKGAKGSRSSRGGDEGGGRQRKKTKNAVSAERDPALGPLPPPSFHFLNLQKRLLREFAKANLGLGTRWRSSLVGIVSCKGVQLDDMPSSQWTQVRFSRARAFFVRRAMGSRQQADGCVT